MDKKTWIVISLCLLGIFFYQPLLNHFYPPVPLPAHAPEAAQTATASTPVPAVVPETAAAAEPQLGPATEKIVAEEGLAEEKTAVLENSWVRAVLTTHGGGLKSIELKKHRGEKGTRIILNRGSEVPIYNIAGWTGKYALVGYDLQSADGKSVTFARLLQPGVQLRRTYTLTGDYNFELSQTISNQTAETKVLPPYRLGLGAAIPIHTLEANERRYIALSWFTKGGNYSSQNLMSFDPTSFVGIKFSSGKTLLQSPQNEELLWAAVSSQFFVLLTRCEGMEAKSAEGRKHYFPDSQVEVNAPVPDGVAGDLWMPGVRVDPAASAGQKFSLYAGPKEDSRLRILPDKQDKVMDFGWLAFVSRALLMLMNGIHSFTHNYGLSIILVTIILRAVLWYPQTKANLSMKRMQAVAPLMKEIQDKHKDNPEKLNQEMLKIYKEYGVNPVGGCLPMLIQFPIFLGFYYMLQSAIELRYESFLWVTDLSMPDTIAILPIPGLNIPINPMPLIMTATMYISMQVTPQPAGVDNPTAKMMKFMPFIFLAFCYNFSSALSLYWTMQNILSIIQMRYNMKQAAPDLEALKQEALKRRKKPKNGKR